MKLNLSERVLARCADLPTTHIHCIHGHSADCPDPGDCVYPELEDAE